MVKEKLENVHPYEHAIKMKEKCIIKCKTIGRTVIFMQISSYLLFLTISFKTNGPLNTCLPHCSSYVLSQVLNTNQVSSLLLLVTFVQLCFTMIRQFLSFYENLCH